jgi:predicted dehydrogenase
MNIDRRTFVKGASAGAAGLALSSQTAVGYNRIVGANEKVVVGFVGTGGMGRSNLKDFLKMPEVEVAAVCDVFQGNLDEASKMTGGKASPLKDFRRIIDNKDVDVVVVSTPDHWHALPMIYACDAGKDVYVEKPVSLTIHEGRKMVEAARRNKRVVQVGTQQRSGKHFQHAAELVRNGKLGKVSYVRAWNFENQHPNGIGSPPDSAPPADLDWNMWLGPAPKVPYNKNRALNTFRWFWDYAGGKLTDWGVHLLDVVQWAMNVEYPQAVSAAGGKFYLQDNRETPDTLTVTYEYPTFLCTYENRECNGTPLDGHDYGITFHGTDGTLFVDRGGFEITPDKRRDKDKKMVDRMEAMKEENSNDQHLTHVRNFFDCVKSRQTPASDIEIAHRSTSTCHLGNIALRSNAKITWDGEREQIVGNAVASKFLRKEYRNSWKLT